jgi:hypothetical protein
MEARTASRAYAERPEGEDCEVVQMTTVKCGATDFACSASFACFAFSSSLKTASERRNTGYYQETAIHSPVELNHSSYFIVNPFYFGCAPLPFSLTFDVSQTNNDYSRHDLLSLM